MITFLHTESRRRMAAITGSTFFFSLVVSGTEVALPLWATQELGFSAADWANLRSLRMAGVLAGVVVLGAVSDRFGQRLIGALSIVGAGLLILGFGLVPSPRFLWWGMPVFGACVSTGIVNINTLTQSVSRVRQGLANAIFRSVGASTAIAAPILITRLALAWHGYRPVFLACVTLMMISAVILWLHPRETPVAPFLNLREELRQMGAAYHVILRNGPLMRFIHLSNIWTCILLGVSSFAPIYFTRELGYRDEAYGNLAGIASALTVLILAISPLALDRFRLPRLFGIGAICAAACSVLMGLAPSPLHFIEIGFVIFAPLSAVLIIPSSMWVSQSAGPDSQTAAFSVQKVFGAAYAALAMLLLGLLEHWIGMRAIFLYGGILGMLFSLTFFTLPNPRK